MQSVNCRILLIIPMESVNMAEGSSLLSGIQHPSMMGELEKTGSSWVRSKEMAT